MNRQRLLWRGKGESFAGVARLIATIFDGRFQGRIAAHPN
jgi:hypothetical protein